MGFGRAKGNQLGLFGRKIDRLPAIRSHRRDDLSGACPMSATEPQAGSPAPATMLLAAMRRLGCSVLPFVVVILIWQFASLFFPRFLFPSLIDVFWRCLEIFSSGT